VHRQWSVCIVKPVKNEMDKPKVVVLCGPTAVGKTSAAIALAQEFKAQIVNADSMQVYRYMDIGTAKPTRGEQEQVIHHLIDIADPDEPFDAAKYARQARRTIEILCEKNITALIVGGTGLYIKALVHGLFEAAPIDVILRSRLKEEIKAYGTGALYARLRSMDPQTAARIHPNDVYRILRAVEVYEATGRPLSEYQREHRFSDQPYRVLKIGLHMDRKQLYLRIDSRVEEMIQAGLCDEVKKLTERGYGRDLKPMQSIGYRHMTDFLEGRLTWEEAIRTLKQDTRRYAKRQMTWFNKDTEIIWKNPDSTGDMMGTVRLFLEGR
jgi:tRNA dimethylallyltransferase